MRGRARASVWALVTLLGSSALALSGGTPAAAAGPGVATMASGEYHVCAVRTNGTVWCWGDDGRGQLGDGTTGDSNGVRTSPVQVLRGSSTLKGVTKIAAAASHTCAVRTDGTVWCWGDASQGQLGNDEAGPGAHRTKAVRVARVHGDLAGVEHVAAGGNHTCALRTDGSVFCWGWAEYGQLGDGTTGAGMGNVRSGAVRVRQGSGYLGNVIAIAAGSQHSCAVKRDGSVWCWGDGSFGQLGDGESGTGHQRTKAIRVERGSGYLTRASGISAGGFHTCVRRKDASAWCWGYAQTVSSAMARPAARRPTSAPSPSGSRAAEAASRTSRASGLVRTTPARVEAMGRRGAGATPSTASSGTERPATASRISVSERSG